MTLAGLTLLRPWWLAALPVVVALALYAVRRAAPLGDWGREVDPALMAYLSRTGSVLGGKRGANLAAGLCAAGLVLGLAGPAVERRDTGTFRNLDETILVVDLSRSVAEGGNLQGVREAAASVAQAAGTRPVALVIYAGDAYLAASPPPTGTASAPRSSPSTPTRCPTGAATRSAASRSPAGPSPRPT